MESSKLEVYIERYKAYVGVVILFALTWLFFKPININQQKKRRTQIVLLRLLLLLIQNKSLSHQNVQQHF